MLTKRACVFWIGFAIYGLAIGLPAWWGLSQFHPPLIEARNESSETGAQENRTFIIQENESYLDKAIEPIAIAAYALFLVTGWLAYFTRGLFRETRSLARDTKETGDRQVAIAERQATTMQMQADLTLQIERAFVFINTFEVHVINAEVWILPQWMNSGSTLANFFRNYVNWKTFVGTPTSYSDLDTSGNPLSIQGASSPTYIAPKSTQFAERMKIPLSVMEDVRGGQTRLFVWGWGEYRDTFAGTPLRRSEFCNEVIVTNIRTNPTTGEVTVAISMTIHGPYNTAN